MIHNLIAHQGRSSRNLAGERPLAEDALRELLRTPLRVGSFSSRLGAIRGGRDTVAASARGDPPGEDSVPLDAGGVRVQLPLPKENIRVCRPSAARERAAKLALSMTYIDVAQVLGVSATQQELWPSVLILNYLHHQHYVQDLPTTINTC